MDILFNSIEQYINNHHGIINKSTSIKKIKENPSSISLYDSNNNENEFDYIFFTGSTFELTKLQSDLPENYKQLLKSIKYKGIICAVLLLKKRLSNIYWMNVIDSKAKFGVLVEHTNFISEKHYNNNHILYLPCYVDHIDSLFSLSDEEITNFLINSLKDIFPSFSNEWINKSFLFKDLYATPLYSLNYSKSMPSYTTPISKLFILNTAQVYPEDRNMNNCIKNAQNALRKLNLN